jgi:hypothetical protein
MTSHRFVGFVTAAGIACALVACKETTSSANIRTPGISMAVEVVARSASSSTVTATLQVGGPNGTYVILDAPDAIYASAGDDRKKMQAVEDGVYEAKFSVADEDTEFTVELDREEEDDAMDNQGSLPAPFEITSSYPDPLSRADDDILVTWDPAGADGTMQLEIEDDVGGCIAFDEDEEVGDTGSYTVKAKTLKDQDDEMPETCDATLTLSRSRTGDNDAVLDSESTFVLMQVRSDVFQSAP